MKRIIYCDESGFTGYNLLDPNQPVFAVASTDIQEDEATEILRYSFPSYRGTEFKFSNLWRSTNRKGLLKFAERLRGLEDSLFAYIIDKKFGTLTKIVDFLIEPYITSAGYDFYDDGFCWKYCNYIYFGFTQFAPPELLDTILKEYQTFSRNPTQRSLLRLQGKLKRVASSSSEYVQVFVQQMELGARLFHEYYRIEIFRGADELQLTTMLAVVGRWRQKFSEDFVIVHDNSSNFFHRREMWERMTNENVPEQSHRLGDGTFVEFPLRVVATQAVDSKCSASVQFCDILAGLATKHFSYRTGKEDRKFLDEVIDAGLGNLSYSGIMPSHEFPDQIPPKQLLGPDVVDQMTEIIFGSHNRG